MASRELKVQCPQCGARIRVDPRSGKVLVHGEEAAGPQDLGDAVRRSEDRKAKASSAWDQAVDAEKHRKQELEDLFRKASENAKDAPDDERPENPMDDRWR